MKNAPHENRSALVGCLVAALLAVNLGCSFEPSADLAQPEQPLVQQELFDRAFQVVSAIDYLPFDYIVDGCYARSLYMSMELASQQIESNSIYAFSRNKDHLLQVGEQQWSFHVTPMLMVESASARLESMVMDPALSDQPLTAAQWLSAMGRTKPEYVASASGKTIDVSPRMVVVPGSTYSLFQVFFDLGHLNQDIPSFAKLPPFRTRDIKSACSVMAHNIDKELLQGSIDQATADYKRKRLLDRTRSMVQALDNLDKLERQAWFIPLPYHVKECLEAATPRDRSPKPPVLSFAG